MDDLSILPVDTAALRDQIARSGLNGARARNVDEAAQEFEAMVASQLMAPMMETLPVDETFGGGVGEETFRGFLLQEYGKIAAQTGALGLSDDVRSVMLRIQQGTQGTRL